MDVATSLVSSPQVVAYFVVLGWAIHGCGTRLNWGLKDQRNGIALAGAVAVVAATWFLILRWTVEYKQSGGDQLFDAAYIDVLKVPHFGTSSQLLTWVVVAAVWAHGAHPCYMMFGMLGAMSAAFLCWVPVAQPSRRKIPVVFVATSALAMYSITMLTPSSENLSDFVSGNAGNQHLEGFNLDTFGPWLKALHVLLVLPLWIAWIYPDQPKVDGTLLYGALALATSAFHLSQVNWSLLISGNIFEAYTSLYVLPTSDCQLSITTDLIVCAIITIWVIYKDSRGSVIYTLVLLLALPIISPASVLALHMGLMHMPAFHAEWVTSFQQSMAQNLRQQSKGKSHAAMFGKMSNLKKKKFQHAQGSKSRGKTPVRQSSSSDKSDPLSSQAQWTNLGLWKTSNQYEDYDSACERLAVRLAEAAQMEHGDAVLSCGCGRGDELHLYKERFGVRHVTGLDPDPSAAFNFRPKHNVRLLNKSASDISSTFMPAYFNKIVALDNVYHYPSKYQFFADAAKLLDRSDVGEGGGGVAVTDIILSNALSSSSSSTSVTQIWLRCLLRFAGIPSINIWTEEEYVSHLESLGFSNVQIDRVGKQVLPRWLPSFMLQYLDYGIVSASFIPPKNSPRSASLSAPSRIKVAVVGSGLAGLSAAHNLTSSGAPVDVTIFESRSKAGLSGDAEVVSDTTVDIPLRMIGKGYYSYVEELANNVGVPTVVAPTDCCFYGASDGSKNSSTGIFALGSSIVMNFFRAIPFVSSGLKFDHVLQASAGSSEFDNEKSESTFGDWMDLHGYSIAGGVEEGRSITMKDSTNPLVWAMMGQLSWVLSCSYEQARGYPAKIILDFFRSLSLNLTGGMLGASRKIVRVHPSIDALQLALSYGSELVCDTRIKGIEVSSSEKGVWCDGKHFDYVIVATEAMAVKHVLGPKLIKDAASPYKIFDKVRYQPSSIVLHTDPCAMPPNRSDWRALNVEMQPHSDMSQLTVWLNAYYPAVDFPEDTFETWNALRPVKGVQKEAFFQRVVHTKNTPRILDEIESIQGKNGIYFAGSYCVYGMGLLEQAACSGKSTSEKLLDDAACFWLNESQLNESDIAN